MGEVYMHVFSLNATVARSQYKTRIQAYGFVE